MRTVYSALREVSRFLLQLACPDSWQGVTVRRFVETGQSRCFVHLGRLQKRAAVRYKMMG